MTAWVVTGNSARIELTRNVAGKIHLPINTVCLFDYLTTIHVHYYSGKCIHIRTILLSLHINPSCGSMNYDALREKHIEHKRPCSWLSISPPHFWYLMCIFCYFWVDWCRSNQSLCSNAVCLFVFYICSFITMTF